MHQNRALFYSTFSDEKTWMRKLFSAFRNAFHLSNIGDLCRQIVSTQTHIFQAQ